MSTLFQVGAGSGGMVVLDLLCREPAVKRIVLLEPDVYKSHNVHRHYFGIMKSDSSKPSWPRSGSAVSAGPGSGHTGGRSARPGPAGGDRGGVAGCDLGICAVDNEPAKYHFDALMRKHRKPWTLGEVLSGGIGGWVHVFRPGRGVLRLRGQPPAAHA